MSSVAVINDSCPPFRGFLVLQNPTISGPSASEDPLAVGFLTVGDLYTLVRQNKAWETVQTKCWILTNTRGTNETACVVEIETVACRWLISG